MQAVFENIDDDPFSQAPLNLWCTSWVCFWTCFIFVMHALFEPSTCNTKIQLYGLLHVMVLLVFLVLHKIMDSVCACRSSQLLNLYHTLMAQALVRGHSNRPTEVLCCITGRRVPSVGRWMYAWVGGSVPVGNQ